jgi:hypothetical protein
MVKPNRVIELAANDRCLRISPNENEWSSVVLCEKGIERPLGRGTLKDIISKLLLFVTDRKILKFKWILTLSELHHVFYGTNSKDKAILRIQDENCNPIAEFQLGSKQRKDLEKILRSVTLKDASHNNYIPHK